MLRIYLCRRSYTHGMVDPRWYSIRMWRRQKLFLRIFSNLFRIKNTSMWNINSKVHRCCGWSSISPLSELYVQIDAIQTYTVVMKLVKVTYRLSRLTQWMLYSTTCPISELCKFTTTCPANIPVFQMLLWILWLDVDNCPMKTIVNIKPCQMVYISTLWLDWMRSY